METLDDHLQVPVRYLAIRHYESIIKYALEILPNSPSIMYLNRSLKGKNKWWGTHPKYEALGEIERVFNLGFEDLPLLINGTKKIEAITARWRLKERI